MQRRLRGPGEGGGRLRPSHAGLVETDNGATTSALGRRRRLVDRKGVVSTADDGAGVVLWGGEGMKVRMRRSEKRKEGGRRTQVMLHEAEVRTVAVDPMALAPQHSPEGGKGSSVRDSQTRRRTQERRTSVLDTSVGVALGGGSSSARRNAPLSGLKKVAEGALTTDVVAVASGVGPRHGSGGSAGGGGGDGRADALRGGDGCDRGGRSGGDDGRGDLGRAGDGGGRAGGGDDGGGGGLGLCGERRHYGRR